MAHHDEVHFIHRAGWLRAAVLGANDGIVSTASLVLGVAAADAGREAVVLSGLAGLVAGAMSMAAATSKPLENGRGCFMAWMPMW